MNLLQSIYVNTFEYYNNSISNEKAFSYLKQNSLFFNELLKCVDADKKRKRNKLNIFQISEFLNRAYTVHFTANNNNEKYPSLWGWTFSCWWRLQNEYKDNKFVMDVLTAQVNEMKRTSKTISEVLDI